MNAICDDDDIKAISFVGSNVVSCLIIVCFFHFFDFIDSSFVTLNAILSEN